MKLKANNIDIEVEDTHPGDVSGRPVVLLIMGLGMQLIAWPPGMVQALVDAGYRVVRFDNRDAGLSQKFAHLGMPNLLWEGLKFRLRMTVTPRYSLKDMAADALGVLDALQIEKAHVVGVSMGGMMAQRLALLAPTRLKSLTSIMSTSGARGLPEASPAVTRVLLKRPGKGLDAAIDHTVKLLQTIGSPGFPTPQPELREKVAAAAARSFYPPGIVRQMVAIVADTTRASELQAISVPALVIHGRADPLVPFAGGEDTARRIPGAVLHSVDGMGHDLPPGVVERILAPLIPHLKAADALQNPRFI
ncbi:MAG: alpha/beta hydrolase [Pseudomonadota bacterium]